MSAKDPGPPNREAFPSCDICGAVVRRQLMRLHHAWHDDFGYSPTRRLSNETAGPGSEAGNTRKDPPDELKPIGCGR